MTAMMILEAQQYVVEFRYNLATLRIAEFIDTLK